MATRGANMVVGKWWHTTHELVDWPAGWFERSRHERARTCAEKSSRDVGVTVLLIMAERDARGSAPPAR